jgi:hypothetical protein
LLDGRPLFREDLGHFRIDAIQGQQRQLGQGAGPSLVNPTADQGAKEDYRYADEDAQPSLGAPDVRRLSLRRPFRADQLFFL